MMKYSARKHTNDGAMLLLQLLILILVSPGRVLAQEWCNRSNPCAFDPKNDNERPQFCDFYSYGALCTPCPDHPDACATFVLSHGSPLIGEGIYECTAECTAKECSKDNPCSGGGEYYCNFEDGADVGGLCEFCGRLTSSEECSLQGLNKAGAESCRSCEVFGVECSELEPCPSRIISGLRYNSFCDFSLDDNDKGICQTCEPWLSNRDFCSSSDLSAAGVTSCAAACAKQCCIAMPGVAVFSAEGEEYDAQGIENSPPVSEISGPLIHCPDNMCGDDVDATGGVCLIEGYYDEGDYVHKLSEVVHSCEDIGGVAAVLYDKLDEGESPLLGYLNEETRIPSIGISNPNGLLLLGNAIGSTASISLEKGEEVCDISCSESDLLPPCSEGRYCSFDFETHGYCYECEYGCNWASTLKGGQECVSSCGSEEIVCSDLLPPCPEGRYCDFYFETHGYCYECEDDCDWASTLKGGQECVSSCGNGEIICSDSIPCPGESFCTYLYYETHGYCEECQNYGDELANDCYFSGFPSLKSANNCASTCGSVLDFPDCKFCPNGLDTSQLLSPLQDGEDACEFCPGGLDWRDYRFYEKFGNQEVRFFGEGVTCYLMDRFYEDYNISKSNPICNLAHSVNYLCGCEGIGYGGANTETKRTVLAWLPRTTAILSFMCSAFIIVDILREKKKRKKLYGQLVVGLSIFDLFGSASYALTTLPLPQEDGIYGSHGNTATCKAQGFFIQLGTISSYINVSLAVYYLLIIKYSWSENKIKKWRVWLFSIPILVGAAFAFAGIPFYDNTILWCNNSSSYWSEAPLCIAIFLATCIMSVVCVHVYKVDQASARWRQGGTAPANTLSKQVFWQSFWFTSAFYITWVPYLALQFMWTSGKAYSKYGFIVFAGTACTLQGFWNFFVYMRPRTEQQRANFFSSIRSKLNGCTNLLGTIGTSTPKGSSAPASTIPTVPPSNDRSENVTELAGSTKNTSDLPELDPLSNMNQPETK